MPVLLLLIGLFTLCALFLVLLSLALTRLCLARARVCHPRQRPASGDTNMSVASEPFEAIYTESSYPSCVSGELDEYSAGGPEMDTELVQRDSVLIEEGGCVEIRNQQTQNNVDSACDLHHEQSRNSGTDIEDYES